MQANIITKANSVMTSGHRAQFRAWWSSTVSALLFLVIPLVFVFAVFHLTKAKGPQWLPFTFENPYNYLFNSLLLVKGEAPYSIDHPGTTTQVFGAIVLRASSLASNEDLIKTVIRRPEHYIRILHWDLITFTVLVLWLVPWLTAKALGNRFVGLLLQAPSLFFSTLLWYGVLFGPDLMLVPFSVAAVCCCALLAIPSRSAHLTFLLGIGDDQVATGSTHLRRIPVTATVTGLICALGVATKLTFFPLVLISLLCCRSRKNLLAFSIAFISALAVALLPIYSRLGQLMTWAFNLGIHSGRYDTGDVGLPQSSVYLSALRSLVETEPLVVIIPIVATITVLGLSLSSRKQTSENIIVWRTALVLLVIQAISFFAIAKEMGVHYLIPLSLTTGLNLLFLVQACRSVSRSKVKRTIGRIVLIGLLLFVGKSSFERTTDLYASLQEQKRDLVRLYRHAEEVTQNDVRVDYFFSDSPIYPLCYGNDWAGGAFGPILSSLYPNQLFLNIFNGRFQTFSEWIKPEDILKKYDHLYFLGNAKWFPKIKGFEPETLETIDQGGNYSLQRWTRK